MSVHSGLLLTGIASSLRSCKSFSTRRETITTLAGSSGGPDQVMQGEGLP